MHTYIHTYIHMYRERERRIEYADFVRLAPPEKGLSGLSQNKNFRETSRSKQTKAKLCIWVGAKFREALVFTPSKVIHLKLSPTPRACPPRDA